MGVEMAWRPPNNIHASLDLMMGYLEEMMRTRIACSSDASLKSKGITCSSSNESSPRKPPTHLLSVEEAMMETKLKGNLLSRINHLELHLHKLEEVMIARTPMKKVIIEKKKQRSDKQYNEIRKKHHSSLGVEQLLKQFRRRNKRPVDHIENDKDAKPNRKSLLHKLFHPIADQKLTKGWGGFLLGPCKGALVEEHNHEKEAKTKEEPIRHKNLKIKRKEEEDMLKKNTLPMLKVNKLKNLEDVEISRVLSLQGIQTCTTWGMKRGR